MAWWVRGRQGEGGGQELASRCSAGGGVLAAPHRGIHNVRRVPDEQKTADMLLWQPLLLQEVVRIPIGIYFVFRVCLLHLLQEVVGGQLTLHQVQRLQIMLRLLALLPQLRLCLEVRQ